MKRLVCLAFSLLSPLSSLLSVQGQTLDECQQAAERNYPLIRQLGLTAKATGLTVDNIAKGWLPQVSASAQATYQSSVTAWPDEMKGMMQQMGIGMEGLKRDQYRVGVDVQQTVYDGGLLSSQQAAALQQGEVETAQTETALYEVRRRVNEMYFALLLVDARMQMNGNLQQQLAATEKKLQSMAKHGTAAESDYLSVKAERLSAGQQLTALRGQRQQLARVLSAFCGLAVEQPVKPAPLDASSGGLGQRPELRAIDAQLRLADVQEKALDAALRPKVGVFAQGFYGYPGLNMFEDMMHRRWSLNGLIGARVTWNIGALYTRKNDKAKLQVARQQAETRRDVFLFNNGLEQMEHSEGVSRYRRMMADDEEIIALRSRVRVAADSKLAHGIIDVNDLVKEIRAENNARVEQVIHEIEMLKEMYDLKFAMGDAPE